MNSTLTTQKSDILKLGDIVVYRHVNPIDSKNFLTVYALVIGVPTHNNPDFQGCCIYYESVGTSHGWSVGTAAHLPINNWTKVTEKVTVEFIP